VPPCSQNAHDETVLVRCAQLRAALATPSKRGGENWKTFAREKIGSRVNGCKQPGGWAGGILRAVETTPAASLGEYWGAGLRQRQVREFALTGAVFDQEDGGVRHHNYKRTSAGNVPGAKMNSSMM
jgi:hypothetical protein